MKLNSFLVHWLYIAEVFTGFTTEYGSNVITCEKCDETERKSVYHFLTLPDV